MTHPKLDISSLIDKYSETEGSPPINAAQRKSINHERVLAFLQWVIDQEFERIIEKIVERNQPMLDIPPAKEPDFLLPDEKRAEAMRAYDACGAIRLTIRRTVGACQVEIKRLVEDITTETRTEDQIEAEEVAEAQEEGRDGQLVRQMQQTAHHPPAVAAPGSGLSLFIGVPTSRAIHPAILYSIFGQLKRTPSSRLTVASNASIEISRNRIAHGFMASGFEWLYMQDDDIIAPFGSAPMLHGLTGMKNNQRFMELVASEKLAKSGKTLVGGVYVTRNSARQIVCNIGMKPTGLSEEDQAKEIKAKGAHEGLLRMKWIGFGCVVIHKSVFAAIQTAFPEAAPKEKEGMWDYFNFSGGGEDITFCQRAERAGHPPFLDTSIVCGHIGEAPFIP